MWLEAHTSEQGSEGTYFSQSPPLDFPFEIETWLDMFRDYCPKVSRVYAHWKGVVEVVWGIGEKGELQYIGRSRWYRPRKHIVHRYPGRTGVATLRWGIDVKKAADAERLAERLMRGEAGAVILLNDNSILRAWEKTSSGVQQVAQRKKVIELPFPFSS